MKKHLLPFISVLLINLIFPFSTFSMANIEGICIVPYSGAQKLKDEFVVAKVESNYQTILYKKPPGAEYFEINRELVGDLKVQFLKITVNEDMIDMFTYHELSVAEKAEVEKNMPAFSKPIYINSKHKENECRYVSVDIEKAKSLPFAGFLAFLNYSPNSLIYYFWGSITLFVVILSTIILLIFDRIRKKNR